MIAYVCGAVHDPGRSCCITCKNMLVFTHAIAIRTLIHLGKRFEFRDNINSSRVFSWFAICRTRLPVDGAATESSAWPQTVGFSEIWNYRGTVTSPHMWPFLLSFMRCVLRIGNMVAAPWFQKWPDIQPADPIPVMVCDRIIWGLY